MVCLFLAEGFEEIEALSVVDILRRGNVNIKMVSINDKKEVEGAHGIKVLADITVNEINETVNCVILPGGIPGTPNLQKSEEVEKCVKKAYADGKIIAAICAAPSVFYNYGLLNGKKATSYPDYEKEMSNCNYTGNAVERDGNIVTSKGAGTAAEFAFTLLSMIKGEETSIKIRKAMQFEG